MPEPISDSVMSKLGLTADTSRSIRQTVTIDLTPALLSMAVIARTKDAVYLRIPRELQRDCGGCSCEQCKANPDLAKWDTLVVPIGKDDSSYHSRHSHTVHMPDGSVAGFKEYVKRKGL